jgi:hypothetical protein
MKDFSYIDQGLFTAFIPNTPEAETAWRELATVTEGTGKVPTIQAKQFIYQLRKAGYTVGKAPKAKPLTTDQIDDMLAELES